jgi:hypothetical protein
MRADGFRKLIGRSPALAGRRYRRARKGLTGRLFAQPDQAANPPLDVAGCPDQIILEPHFAQASIPRPPQTVRSHQFALGAFDGIARFHFLFKFFGALFVSPRLQSRMMLAHHHGPMALVFAQALLA